MCGLASCRTPSWRGGSAAAYSQEVCLALPYVNDRRVRAGTINVGDFGSSSVNGQFASDGGATKPALLLDERRTPFLVCEAARQRGRRWCQRHSGRAPQLLVAVGYFGARGHPSRARVRPADPAPKVPPVPRSVTQTGALASPTSVAD